MNRLAQLCFRGVWRVWNDAATYRGRGEIDGRLERPQRRQHFSRWVDVRGWAVSLRGEPLTVRLALNGRLLKELAVCAERPEIVHLHPDNPTSPRSGFEGVISLEQWRGSRGILTATAVSKQDPQSRRTLGVALLHRRRTGERQVPRSAYQETWEAVSRSLSDARYSVAGTADDTELERSGQSTAADIVAETAIGANDRVLEIGCGVGRVGVHLAEQCAHWTGADVSQHMLRHAKHALAGHTNVSFVHLNGIDLAGVADASMDAVYCTAVFMHLDEWERYRYVMEAFRVLTPGGRVYYDNFSLLAREGWRLFEQLARLDPAARPPNISKASTPEELRAYAEHVGFEDIRVRPGEMFATVIARKPATSRSDP
jgi:ubiquinone/menaquinone biosynthesis C-methylase UbiE